LRYIAGDDVFFGDLFDAGRAILPNANNTSPTTRANVVFAVPGGPRKTM
jgi:hypothetical protein